jgi:tRNA (guanine-N7-)-methyltransferase
VIRRKDLPQLFFKYLILWKKFPLPLNFKEILNFDPPYLLEIGFGDGYFLVERAKENPEKMFLGVEISFISVKKTILRAEREGVYNLRIVKGDARVVLNYAFPPQCLDTVYVLFPDPWPKKRHLKRRLMNRWFLEVLATRMISHGKLILETDDEGYREFFLEELKETEAFRVTLDQCDYDGGIETKYKRKWKEEGRRVYHLELERVEDFEGVPIPKLELENMPHERIAFDIPLSKIAQSFKPTVQRSSNAVLAIKEVFVSGSEKEALFLVHVDEGPLNQQVIVRAARRSGEVLVKLDYLGDPLITEGVKDAVREVARLIKEIASK